MVLNNNVNAVRMNDKVLTGHWGVNDKVSTERVYGYYALAVWVNDNVLPVRFNDKELTEMRGCNAMMFSPRKCTMRSSLWSCMMTRCSLWSSQWEWMKRCVLRGCMKGQEALLIF